MSTCQMCKVFFSGIPRRIVSLFERSRNATRSTQLWERVLCPDCALKIKDFIDAGEPPELSDATEGLAPHVDSVLEHVFYHLRVLANNKYNSKLVHVEARAIIDHMHDILSDAAIKEDERNKTMADWLDEFAMHMVSELNSHNDKYNDFSINCHFSNMKCTDVPTLRYEMTMHYAKWLYRGIHKRDMAEATTLVNLANVDFLLWIRLNLGPYAWNNDDGKWTVQSGDVKDDGRNAHIH